MSRIRLSDGKGIMILGIKWESKSSLISERVGTPLIGKHAANKLPEIRRFAIPTMLKLNSFHSYFPSYHYSVAEFR